jgi:hypothetical protein
LASAFVTFLFIYKSICLFFSKGIALLSTFSCLAFLLTSFNQGNLAEEYTLPFISMSLYYFLIFLKERKIRWGHFFIISICFGCILLIKPNAAISCVVGWITVTFLLLLKKNWLDLLKIGLISLGGVILVLIPLIVYLFITDSFADFKACYFDFNGAYSDISFRILIRMIHRSLFLPVLQDMTYISILLSTLLFVFSYDSYQYKLPILFYFVLMIATFIAIAVSDTNFYHYYMILVPVLAYSYAMVYDAIKKHIHAHSAIILVLLFLIFNSTTFFSYRQKIRACFKEKALMNNIITFVDRYTEKNDKIYVIGNACLFYNITHRESASKYPYLAPVIDIKGYKEAVLNQFLLDMETNHPKVILYDTSWLTEIDWIVHGEYPELIHFLEENYVNTQSYENFDCYLRK